MRIWIVSILASLLTVAAHADDAGVAFFESRVRPILVEQCYSCHSAKAKKPKAGLYVDSRTGLLKGGESGPSLVPGDPGKQGGSWDEHGSGSAGSGPTSPSEGGGA